MTEHLTADVASPPTPARRSGRGIGDLWILQGNRAVALATVVLALVTWPFGPGHVSRGIDSSWRAGMSIASADGLVFGRDIVWTYGPLGFLVSPFTHVTEGMATIVVRGAVYVALVAVVLVLLRRHCSLGIAVLIALPIVGLGAARFVEYLVVSQVLTLLVVIWAFSSLTDAGEGTWRWPAGIGAMLGIATLTKFDAIAFMLVAAYAVCARAYISGAGVRSAVTRVVILAGSFAATVIVVWVLLGLPLGAVRSWFSTSFEVARGYGDAMGTENSKGFGTFEYLFPPLLMAVYAWLILRHRALRLGARVAVVGLVAIVLFLGFKMGFTRHTLGHSVFLFALVTVIPLGLLAILGLPRALALLSVGIIGFLAATGVHPRLWFSPDSTATRLADSARLLVSANERSDFIADGRARLRASYALPDELIDLMHGRTVHVEPANNNVVYAHPGVDWRPLPMFHTSNAYTSRLDDLNADLLAGERRPDLVLRERRPAAVDRHLPRLPQFVSPRAAVELACRYRPVWSDADWELLEAGDDRCGTRRTRSAREATLAESVTVPEPSEPDTIVVARFNGVDTGVVNELRSLLYKAPEFSISAPGVGPHRFLPGTQRGPHILRMPACADASDHIEFDSFTISKRRDFLGTGNTFDVEFEEIPFAC